MPNVDQKPAQPTPLGNAFGALVGLWFLVTVLALATCFAIVAGKAILGLAP